MKSYSLRNLAGLILIGLFAFVSPVISAESAAAPAAQSAPAEVKTDYKDAFLGFVLEKAQKYSGAVEAAVGKAVDTATVEAPILAHEYLVWQAWYHAVYFVLPLIVFGISFCVFRTNWSKFKFGTGYQSDKIVEGTAGAFAASLVSGIFAVLSLAAFFINLGHLLSFIQVLVAPRVYILEQVIHLVK